MTATVATRRPVGMVDGEFLPPAADFHSIARMLHTQTGITLHECKATRFYLYIGHSERLSGPTVASCISAGITPSERRPGA